MFSGKPARERDRDAREARGTAGEWLGLVQNDVDDDAEAQGGHGQIITPELQGRDADEQGGAARDDQAGQQRQPGVDPVSGGEDAGGIGPQPEKGGVAQGDLAGVAQQQVESHHQQGMDADEIEQGEIVFIVQADGQGQDQHGK